MIYIGCDHGGFALKQEIFKYIKEDLALEIEDLGCHDTSSVDYPDYAEKVCNKVVSENAQGILICGTGIGISNTSYPTLRMRGGDYCFQR